MYDQKRPSPRYRVMILASLACGVFMTVTTTKVTGQNPTPKRTIDKAMVKVASEINQNLPFMIDSMTRLDRTVPGPGKELVYQYTLITLTRAEVREPGKISKLLRLRMVERFKTDPRMKPIRELGIILRHSYFDKNGAFVTEFSVTPDDLK
jgi:hypothetical protein